MMRQLSGHDGMADLYGKFDEAVRLHLRFQIVRRLEFSDGYLDRHFPSGSGADKYRVRFGDGRAGSFGELPVLRKPPKQDMGIEQQPQSLSP